MTVWELCVGFAAGGEFAAKFAHIGGVKGAAWTSTRDNEVARSAEYPFLLVEFRAVDLVFLGKGGQPLKRKS